MRTAAKLGSEVSVAAGYPFRGAIPADPAGKVRVLQMRDIGHGAVDWSAVARVKLDEVARAQLLLPGDVLFVPRGGSFHAAAVDDRVSQAPTVAAPQLFRLRIRSQDVLVPEYLAWILNQPALQRDLAGVAGGTAKLLVRRTDVEDLLLPLPDRRHQRRLVALQALADREREVFARLLELRAAELSQLSADLYPPF